VQHSSESTRHAFHGHYLVTRSRTPRRACLTGTACGSAFTNSIASVVTIAIVKTVKNVSTATPSIDRTV
jgi:hypothetical protein